LPGARVVRVATPVRRARQGAGRGACARARQRAAEDRAALAGDAAQGRAHRARPPGDAQRDAGGDAVRGLAGRHGAAARGLGSAAMNRKPAAKPRSAGSARSVTSSPSPLLATPTPPWRSKLLVAMVGLGFAVLLGRAIYVQIVAAPFFLKQGEIRYGH